MRLNHADVPTELHVAAVPAFGLNAAHPIIRVAVLRIELVPPLPPSGESVVLILA